MLSGPLRATVHYATVRHGVCLEHGGTVHLDSHAGGSHAEQSWDHASSQLAASPTPHLDAQDENSDRPASDEHAHCDLLATLNHSAVAETSAPLLAPAAALTVVFEAPAASPPRASGAVYHFAPKTSPPSGDAARV